MKCQWAPCSCRCAHRRDRYHHDRRERLLDPTAHAEMIAITQASPSLALLAVRTLRLYVTPEPLPHVCTAPSLGAPADGRVRRADPKASRRLRFSLPNHQRRPTKSPGPGRERRVAASLLDHPERLLREEAQPEQTTAVIHERRFGSARQNPVADRIECSRREGLFDLAVFRRRTTRRAILKEMVQVGEAWIVKSLFPPALGPFRSLEIFFGNDLGVLLSVKRQDGAADFTQGYGWIVGDKEAEPGTQRPLDLAIERGLRLFIGLSVVRAFCVA